MKTSETLDWYVCVSEFSQNRLKARLNSNERIKVRLLRVNDILLDEPLFCDEIFSANDITASSLNAIDGSEIVFLQENKAKSLNFSSNEISWNTRATLDALINLANLSVSEEITLLTTFGEKKVRFDYTAGSPVSGTPLWAGANLFYIELKFKEI